MLPLRSIPTLNFYTIIRINNGNKPHSLYLAFSWIGGSNAMSANQLLVIFRVKAQRALLGKEISISLNLISRQKHEVLKMSLNHRGPTATDDMKPQIITVYGNLTLSGFSGDFNHFSDHSLFSRYLYFRIRSTFQVNVNSSPKIK